MRKFELFAVLSCRVSCYSLISTAKSLSFLSLTFSYKSIKSFNQLISVIPTNHYTQWSHCYHHPTTVSTDSTVTV